MSATRHVRIGRIVPMVPVVCLVVMAGAACSSGDGTDIGSSPETDTGLTSTSSVPETPSSGQTQPITVADDTGSPTPEVVPSTFPVIPETGVPGLDSEDAFCAAWSRFGGSFQVVAVNAAFGEGSVADRAFVEVAAGPIVVAAIADLTAAWPEELSAEADAALQEVFGPFANRVGTANAALEAVGATPDDLAALADAWLAFLAVRDPADAAVVLDIDAQVSDLVNAAVPIYLDEVGTWDEDESLATDASIPLTEAYLAETCPDQGALAGQEAG